MLRVACSQAPWDSQLDLSLARWVVVLGVACVPLGCANGVGLDSEQQPEHGQGSPADAPVGVDPGAQVIVQCPTTVSIACSTGQRCLEEGPRGTTPFGQCFTNCTEDEDCSEGRTCALGSDGKGACVYGNCDSAQSGFGCLDGRLASCVDDTLPCQDCGCRSGLRCDQSGECVEQSNVAGPCSVDSDCRTGNCSAVLGVCRVPIGSACTTEDCDLCMPNGETTFCSRDCNSYDQCGSVATCVGSTLTHHYECKPKCTVIPDPSCAERCEVASGTGGVFCDLWGYHAPMPLGSVCYGAGCESEECLYVTWYGLDLFDSAPGPGYCTQPCTSDAECSNGTVCATIECSSGQTEGCGSKCMVPCGVASGCAAYGSTCRELPRVSGNPVAVCDPRLRDGSTCSGSNWECQSGRCEEYECIPNGGKPNGSDCANATDCTSGSCVAGRCRGIAILGDACVNSADCAVGTCCADGTCCN